MLFKEDLKTSREGLKAIKVGAIDFMKI